MKRHTAIAALLLIPALMSTAQLVSETKQGLRVDPAGDTPTTEVSVYAPNIIRVTKYADGLEALPAKKSYSVIMTPEKGKGLWSVEGNTLRTACLTVIVDAATGEVRFADADGKALLAEKSEGHAQLAQILQEREVIFAEDVETIFGKRPWTSRTEELLESEPPVADQPASSEQSV